MKKNSFYIILCCLFFSCVKEQEWKLKSVPSNQIVVECTLTNELKQHMVKLSKPYGELNGKAGALLGATVRISYNNVVLTCTENASIPGTYESPIFKTQGGITYTLKIESQGKTYTASAASVPATFFVPLGYALDDTKGLFFFNNEFSSQEPAMFEVTVDWRNSASSYVSGDTTKQAKLFYYVLKTVDLNQISTQQEKVYFPKGSEIRQRKYSLSAAHAHFIRSLLSETKFKGSYFDDYPANVETNLSDGAIGFFGVCEVITITQIVK